MKDKQIRETVKELHNTDLHFTEEDREKVFQKIEKEESKAKSSFFHIVNQRLAPLAATVVLLALSVVLAFSLIDTGNQTADHSDKLSAVDDNEYSSLLLMLKNKQHRTDLHLLITYSQNKGTAKLLSLPKDTYVPLVEADEDSRDYTKLTNIYAYGNGADSVKKSVSETFNMPIDHYISVETEDFEKALNTIGETKLNIERNKVLFSFQDSEIQLNKGMRTFDAREAVSLLTALSKTDGDGTAWNEEDRLKLARAVIKNIVKHIPAETVGNLMAEAESNMELSKVFEEIAATQLNTMEIVSISEGLEPVSIDNIFYLKPDEEYFEKVKKEVSTFE